MSKTTLALKLADELGITVSKASRFIDDVGMTRASRFVDEVGGGDEVSGLPRLVDEWWKPVTAGTGVTVGGALLWRQQDVNRVDDITQESTDWADLATRLAEDETLTPEQKSELVTLALDTYGANRQQQQPPGPGGGILGGDTQTLIVLLIVLALVFNYAMDGDD